MDYSELINKLPKPVSREEQYLYSLILSAANIEHEEPSTTPFWRMEQYWRAFYEVMQDRYTNIVPSAGTVGTVQIQDKAVTDEKLSDDVASKMLYDKNVDETKLSDSVASKLLGDNRITETMLVTALANKLLGNTKITETMLADALIAKLLGEKKVTKAMLAQDVQDTLNKVK